MGTGNLPVQVTTTFNPVSEDSRVTFDRSTIEFTNEAPGIVTFKLSRSMDVVQANFPSNPIQWVEKIDERGKDEATNYRPIKQPDAAVVERLDDSMTRVTIAPKPSSGTLTFRFYVIVQTRGGRFVGSDPTIITMPPGT